jgi:hypothetical protein
VSKENKHKNRTTFRKKPLYSTVLLILCCAFFLLFRTVLSFHESRERERNTGLYQSTFVKSIMISMLCQKTSEGRITSGKKELMQYLVADGAAYNDAPATPKTKTTTETNSTILNSDQSSQKYSSLNSRLLKKYPKTKVN